MKFLKGIGSRNKESKKSNYTLESEHVRQVPSYHGPPPSRDFTTILPPPLLEKVFAFVCPHAEDGSYESCEHSASEDACMLCDLRDLAHCVRVCRRWRKLASNVLYYSIRIDAVHYCAREDLLAEKRKRRLFDRNAEPDDSAQTRLSLLCRTIRNDNSALGQVVRFIKLPYMTRETCKADLARLVGGCPKIQYVDLPDGFFRGDQNCATLRQEVQANCQELRKMSFLSGSEGSLELLAAGNIWRKLESLELNKIDMDPMILRVALGMLSTLRAVKITDVKIVDDSFFQSSPQLPPFPALTELLLEDTPNITSVGIVNYLSNPRAQDNLQTISFTTTGVHPSDLHQVLRVAPNLTKLSIIDSVASPFPNSTSPTFGSPAANSQIPLLASQSLQTLHYEIVSSVSPRYNNPTTSYYAYLTSSLLAQRLPNLRALYVRDVDFASSLVVFVPPRPAFAGEGVSKRFSSNNPFASPAIGSSRGGVGGLRRELEVYTKGDDALEWDFSYVEAPQHSGHGRKGSVSSLNIRPLSLYGLAAGSGGMESGWAGAPLSPSFNGSFSARDVRKSVVVSNGAGGFLAVPDDEARPRSSGSGMDIHAGGSSGEWPGRSPSRDGRRGSAYDMWR